MYFLALFPIFRTFAIFNCLSIGIEENTVLFPS